MNDSEHPSQAPPAGEQLHLPGPSIKPFITAIAITLTVIGTTINILSSIVGLIVLVIVVACGSATPGATSPSCPKNTGTKLGRTPAPSARGAVPSRPER